jgi:hypothetical protein
MYVEGDRRVIKNFYSVVSAAGAWRIHYYRGTRWLPELLERLYFPISPP